MRYTESDSITHLSDIIEEPTLDLLTDENASIFLDFITITGLRLPRCSRSFCIEDIC